MVQEGVVGFVEAFREEKRGTTEFVALCFTPQRLVVAKTGHLHYRPWSFALGLGVILMLRRAKRKARAKAEELTKLPVDEILNSDPYNHDIAYADIEAVEMRTPGSIVAHPIRFKTNKQEHVYGILDANKHFQADLKLVSSVLRDKLVLDGKRIRVKSKK